MSTEDNKAFIRRYLDAISGKPKTEAVSRLFVADQPLIDHILAAEAAFPLYRLDVDEMMAEGDLVSVRGMPSQQNNQEHGSTQGPGGNSTPPGIGNGAPSKAGSSSSPAGGNSSK